MSTDSPSKARPALDALTDVLADVLRGLAGDGHAEEASRLAGEAYAACAASTPTTPGASTRSRTG